MKKSAVFAALPLAAAGVFTGELYRYVFCRGSSPLLKPFLDSMGHDAGYYVWRYSAADALRERPQEHYVLRSARGEKLHGFYIPAGGEGKRIAFIVHGYRSEHADTAGMFYDLYASRGWDIFCCDHTAHGESGGHFIGFDRFESEDCLLWLDFLQERFGPQVQILLHGFSMGSATVMKMSDRCPAAVKFIVADCGYADGREQLRGMLGPLYRPMRLLNRLIAGYDLSETDVRPNLAAARVPILFVHGDADKTVAYENGPALYALYPGEKDCLFVPGAGHMECLYLAPEDYARKLDSFIARFCW